MTGRRLALSLWECQRTGQVTRGATARDGRRGGRGPYHRPIVPLATAWPPITAAAVVASYAAGTLPTAQLVGRHWGVDPTATGSRNPGATNVYRTAGRRAGALTLVGDLCKGAVAAGAGWALGGHGLGVACGVAAVVGHVLPVTRRFRGGKGVATGAGMGLVLYPPAMLAAAAAFVLVARVTRVVALGSIAAAVTLPVGAALLGAPGPELGALALCSGLVVIRHGENIARLRRGEENKLGRTR